MFKSSDELAIDYAKKIGIYKEAWSWQEMATFLGVEAGSAVLFGLGGPPMWIIGGLLFAHGLYDLLSKTDDNLDFLLERLEALDPNDSAKPGVEEWKARLKAYKGALVLPKTSASPKERANHSAKQIKIMLYERHIKMGIWQL